MKTLFVNVPQTSERNAIPLGELFGCMIKFGNLVWNCMCCGCICTHNAAD